jgi:hypothetical protein
MKLKSLFYTLLASAPLLANAAPNSCDLSNIESMSAPQASSCGDISKRENDRNGAVKFYCYAYRKSGSDYALNEFSLITSQNGSYNDYFSAKSNANYCSYK